MHLDNDISTYTHGIGGPTEKTTGILTSFEEGFEMEGGFFYCADYAIMIDYQKIDGVVEQI